MELTNKEQMFKLRDYQQEAVDAGLEYVRKKSKPGIIVAPVGSGKSLVISSLAHEIKSPTLVLQPNVELLHQNIDKLRALGGEATICSASAGERDISELTYATLGSIRNDVNLLKAKGVDTVILDEAQFGYSPDPGSMFKTFLDTLKPKNVIGFTATPFRLKQYSNMSGDRYSQLNMLNRNRPSVFKDFIHITPISKMIEESYWAELSYEEWDFDTSTLRVNSTGAEYTERSISKAISDNNVNTNILGRAKKLVEEGKRMIIFVDSVENAHKMASKLPSSVALDSGTKKSDRNKIVSDFKAGKIQAIVNVGIVGVGFDAPELDVVIIGRPTRSYALLHQWCFDTKTEVLTTTGFKKYDEISTSDIVYGFDKDTEVIKHNQVHEVIDRYQYNDEEKIVSAKTNRIDFRVSSKHDMLYKSHATVKSGYLKAPMENVLKLNSRIRFPTAGMEESVGTGLAPHELQFIGLFLSDGYLSKHGYGIILSQNVDSPYIPQIEEILSKCGFKYNRHRYARTGTSYSDYYHYYVPKNPRGQVEGGWGYLSEYIAKDIPSSFEKVTKEELLHIIEGLFIGDGTKLKHATWISRTKTISTGDNKVMADRLQSLCIRRGISCNIRHEVSKAGTDIYKLKIKDITYATIGGQGCKESIIDGKIIKRSKLVVEDTVDEHLWCLNTEMGTLITRRDGKVTIMGNCGRAVRNPLYPKRKKALIIDFCNNIKEHGKIEDLVIQDYDGYGWGATVGEKLITGVPFGSGITLQDMIEVNKPIDVEKYTMTFGKHKGKKLTELPLGYAKWFLETIDEMNIYGWTKADKESAKAILKRQLISRKVDVPEDLSKLVIVDFNNLMFSWFSRGLLSKDGFENVMDNLKEKFRTTNVMVVKDSRRSSYWRTKLYDDYKATRKSRDTDKKFELGLKDVLDNCEIYEEEGMEADDIISREVRSGKYKEVYVVSTDSDFNQLAFFNCFYKVDYNLKTQRFSKKEAIGTLITKLLKGDAKDNIPKCHEHGRIKTSDLEDAINEVFANIVDYCRLGGCGNIASLPIKKFVQDTLEQKWTLNKEQFDLNFKLINLIQDEN